jgi:hypothetical protein
MGINCALLLADLSSYLFKTEFVPKLLVDKRKKKLAVSFNHTYTDTYKATIKRPKLTYSLFPLSDSAIQSNSLFILAKRLIRYYV